MRRVTEAAPTFALSSSELILGLIAAVLVVFALVVSLVLPRRDPDFPGRRLGLFFAVAVLLVVGMLVAVEALGESHDFAAHGESGEAAGTEPTTPADTQPAETGETGTGETETGATGETDTGAASAGDPAAGQEVFASAGCGSCHAVAAAGSTGDIGPPLDESLQGRDAEYIRTQIVDPSSEIAEGYGPGIMPEDYGEQLSDEELANLVAFLAREAG
jgi:mono/diheme cytochrome c family protein